MAGISDVDEKFRLLRMLKSLKTDIKEAIPQVAKPWLPHPVHVESFFNILEDCLELSGKLGVYDQEWLEAKRAKLANLPRHRDNLPALLALTSELLAVVETETSSVTLDIRNLEMEIERLKAKLSEKDKRIRELETKLAGVRKVR